MKNEKINSVAVVVSSILLIVFAALSAIVVIEKQSALALLLFTLTVLTITSLVRLGILIDEYNRTVDRSAAEKSKEDDGGV